eukprot:scaffold995_cov53-Attheya_sp.AAC.2
MGAEDFGDRYAGLALSLADEAMTWTTVRHGTCGLRTLANPFPRSFFRGIFCRACQCDPGSAHISHFLKDNVETERTNYYYRLIDTMSNAMGHPKLVTKSPVPSDIGVSQDIVKEVGLLPIKDVARE